MRDFMMAAVPLVVAGIALAVFFAGRAEKKKKQEKEKAVRAVAHADEPGDVLRGRRWRHFPGVHRRHPVRGDAYWAGGRNVFREEAQMRK